MYDTRHPPILVIDDEPSIARLLTRMLAVFLPVTPVIQATTAAAGLTLLSKQLIILVIVDYQLPDMNGSQLVQTIHALLPTIPVILCTGMSLEPAELEGLPIAVILAKPFSYNQLQQIISTLIP